MNKIFLKAKWENLVMVNYEINPNILKPYLPKGVELDFFDDKTYVSLVGFMFQEISILGIPIPFIGSFEEINLRFYVKRTEGDSVKRGVVFIKEVVSSKIIAYIANKLFKEQYVSIPTINSFNIDMQKNILYGWKINLEWHTISVTTELNKQNIEQGSFEQFIFERYYGYAKNKARNTFEYRIHHPKWVTNKILSYSIDCDFNLMFGNKFNELNNHIPNSIFYAEGSDIAIKWRKNIF